MSKQLKTIFLSVALTGFVFSSSTVLADKGHVFPGITNPCEQLWLVNDPANEDELLRDPNTGGGECIDVPVNLDEVKVVFNLDNAVTSWSDGTTPVGVRHMALLGEVMKHRIAIGEIAADDVAIVGIFHGPAMSQSKWPFADRPFTAGGMPDAVKTWVHKIFDLQNAGINIQLEVCGVTLKGMQLKMKKKAALTGQPIPWHLMDERAIYSHVHDDDDTDNGLDNATGRIYVNQGAVGRMIELQQHDFAYLQEE
ncbi:MAG: hypothetical protein KAU29_03490 [Gammaproteobacteria bacterium]|nr:hypothetical protein [Gammaproteobacteria bacterium]